MPVERNIGSTLVDTRSVIRITSPVAVESIEGTTALTNTIVDAKEFSLDTVEVASSEESYSIARARCIGPCVQRCLPPPPSPPPPPRCR